MQFFWGEIHQPFETKKLRQKKKKRKKEKTAHYFKRRQSKIGIHTNNFSGGPVKSGAILKKIGPPENYFVCI